MIVNSSGLVTLMQIHVR